MKAHTNLLNRARIALSRIPGVLARAFPNAQGRVVAGGNREVITRPQMVKVNPGDIIVRGGSIMSVGFGAGTSDLVGFVQITIRQEDVGRQILQFACWEGKTKGDRLKTGQKEWDAFIRQHGGLSAEIRSPEDAVSLAVCTHRGQPASPQPRQSQRVVTGDACRK